MLGVQTNLSWIPEHCKHEAMQWGVPGSRAANWNRIARGDQFGASGK